MTLKLYLAHPHFCRSFANKLQSKLSASGMEIVNPFEASGEFHYGSVEVSCVVEKDLSLVEQCDAVVALMPVADLGTMCEVFYAKLKGKPVVILSNMQSFWLEYCGKVVKTEEELFEQLERMKVDADRCLRPNR